MDKSSIKQKLPLILQIGGITREAFLTVLDGEYSKIAFLCADRSVCLHAKYGSHYSLRIPRDFQAFLSRTFTEELLKKQEMLKLMTSSMAEIMAANRQQRQRERVVTAIGGGSAVAEEDLSSSISTSTVDHLDRKYFNFVGKVIALALMHKVQVSIVFDRVFCLQLVGHSITLEDIRDADLFLYSSCKQILEMDAEAVDQDALGLTFVHEIEELGTRRVVEI
ncbi:E3 ubiquitin-protein ligase upl5 [Phtheirospermum japonicum]|uniref:HECT-type E3 ubiquitin transferase n=1 Tax=Phtheirospermum japonicum TaxID=374723 RepID=A0A830BA14_9LAMI|nr:E3 ubiquitin-protein ligase upl5 [Phtheirospermum japonicum]